MRAMKWIARALAITVLCALALGGTALAALAYPQPLFAYRVEQGRLRLYSDRPFDPQRADHLLADVEQRLARSPFNDDNVHRIFIANSEWRRRLLFLWNAGAAGVNYFPLTRNVFIRRADVDDDRVMTTLGEPKAPPRTLAYYATHEIAHTLIKEQLSLLQQGKLPLWINEGIADDTGFGDQADIDGLIRGWQNGDPDLDPKRSGYYDRYRLLVVYFLKRKGCTAAQLVASNMPQAEAEQILMRDIEAANGGSR
jgi:hypothetical protein